MESARRPKPQGAGGVANETQTGVVVANESQTGVANESQTGRGGANESQTEGPQTGAKSSKTKPGISGEEPYLALFATWNFTPGEATRDSILGPLVKWWR